MSVNFVMIDQDLQKLLQFINNVQAWQQSWQFYILVSNKNMNYKTQQPHSMKDVIEMLLIDVKSIIILHPKSIIQLLY